jgi:hypothetical protein
MMKPGSTQAPGALLGAGFLLAASVLAALVWFQATVADLARRTAESEAQLRVLAGEVTRFRIEQRAEGRGPAALLEKLRSYAPLLTSARTADPEFRMAQDEMKAVLRAFEGVGADGWRPVRARLDQLDLRQDFDEARWLLEAAVKVDPVRGKALVVQVLQGRLEPGQASADQPEPTPRTDRAASVPPPRLRWAAAGLLVEIDKTRAQQVLRQILLTESCRGADPDRAAAYNLPIPDPAAVATSGFHNFVVHYLRSGDPETEDTLLQVLQRSEHDLPTVQEVIEELGRRKATRAAKRIEEFYRRPPGASDNPLFLNKCLDAIAAIRGAEARPFLEAELANAPNEAVARHLQHLLK